MIFAGASKNTHKALASSEVAQSYSADKALIQACLGGDQSAWKELVGRYKRLVYSIPLRMGLSADDADEVFQNVFSIVVRQLPRLRNQTLFAAWLIKITQNESLRVSKKSSRDVKNFDFTMVADSATANHLETWERQHLVHQALEQLDPESQKLLTALFLDPSTPTYREVAAKLAIPEGSVGPLRARAFKKLEGILIEMGFEFES